MRVKLALVAVAGVAALALVLWMRLAGGADVPLRPSSSAVLRSAQSTRIEAPSSFDEPASLPEAPEPASAAVNDAMPASSGPGHLHLVDEQGQPWHAEPVHLAIMSGADIDELKQRPLTDIDQVAWSIATPLDDGRIDLPPQDGPCWVQASSAGWRAAPLRLGPANDGTVTMVAASMLEGQVIDADGYPLPGAWVVLRDAPYKDWRKQWSLANHTLDRRKEVRAPDEHIVLADADGRYRLPHAAGLLAVHEDDHMPALAWPTAAGCDVTLASGATLDIEVVGADDRPPRLHEPIFVRIGENKEPDSYRPFSSQYRSLDLGFRCRASGFEPGPVQAALVLLDGTSVDFATAKLEQDSITQMLLHVPPICNLTLRIPESHGALARIDLLPSTGNTTAGRRSTYMRRTSEIDAWKIRVPWWGETDISAVRRGGGAYPLAHLDLEHEEENFELRLPDGMIRAHIAALADAFPCTVELRRSEAQPDQEPWRHLEIISSVDGPNQPAEYTHLPIGDYLVVARQTGGVTLGFARASLTQPGQVVELTLTDDRQPLDVLVVDEDGTPRGQIMVAVDSESMPLGTMQDGGLTDAEGRVHLRVVGPGPFHVWAYDQNVGADKIERNGGDIQGVEPGSGLLRIVLRQVARVTFLIKDTRPAGPAPARISVRSDSGIVGFDRVLDVDDPAAEYPTRLPPASWTVDVLDADGTNILQQPLVIREPGELTVPLTLR